ncbi:MAG: DUF4430 domain-containing protein [Parcubacteria group bacterium]|nr:DUF4430 domain-containing protein [Parcubacteria group bacterium]
MNKQRFLSVFAIVSLVFTPYVGLASVPNTTIQYLKNQPRDAWVMMALRAANVEGLNAASLSVTNLTAATDIERTILGVTAANGNPFSINGVNLVAQLDATRQQNQIGDAMLVNDDIFGILAYLAAGVGGTDTRIAQSRGFIVGKQNSDGGFPFAVNQPSDTNITAMAVNALVRSGLPASDSTNQKALSYLRSAQNNDGGFGYAIGATSDAASTSWIITALRAASIDPNSWTNGGNTPFAFLSRLQMPDGSYKWKITDGQGGVAMTAYAAIALSDRTYPVAVYQQSAVIVEPAPQTPTPVPQPVPTPVPTPQPAPAPQTPTAVPTPTPAPVPQPTPTVQPTPVPQPSAPVVRYRIEGKKKQICQGETAAATPLEVVQKAAKACGFSYAVADSSMSAYVKTIANETASGTAGWLYLVNWQQPQQGAAQYQLSANDYVTWYFGEWTWPSLRVTVTKHSGMTAEVYVDAFDGSAWHGASAGTVWIGKRSYKLDSNGWARIKLGSCDDKLYAEKTGFVRSHVMSQRCSIW